MNEFTEELRRELQQKGVTSLNQAVIKVTGKTKQQVCNILKGRSPFSLADLAKLDRAYDIDAETWKKLIHNYYRGGSNSDTKT